ncbi:MAG: hypothetical protein ACRDFS_06610, partial [Chloroflexota bacterium]
MLKMIFRRFVPMPYSLLHVAVRDQRLMRGVREVLFGIVLRCLSMMYCGLLVMLSGGEVMLGARQY